MNTESMNYLSRLYEGYRNCLESKKKMRSKSALTSSLSIKNNERFRAMNDSSKSLSTIPREILLELKENGFVRNTDDVSTYAITAKGIWEVEKKDGILDETGLIAFIDNNYFNLFEAGKPLADREKVILFGMLSARAFSAESSIDLRKDDSVKDAWKDVMKGSFNKLNELGAIKKIQIEELFSTSAASGVEHPASHLIRHSDQIPRKTRAIFKASGKNKYYLDVEDGDTVSVDKIAFLFWLVLGQSVDPDNVEEINNYCTSVAYNASIYVFDMSSHKYSSPKYDELLREGLIESIVSRARWENG